jgi:hypothetical protein
MSVTRPVVFTAVICFLAGVVATRENWWQALISAISAGLVLIWVWRKYP